MGNLLTQITREHAALVAQAQEKMREVDSGDTTTSEDRDQIQRMVDHAAELRVQRDALAELADLAAEKVVVEEIEEREAPAVRPTRRDEPNPALVLRSMGMAAKASGKPETLDINLNAASMERELIRDGASAADVQEIQRAYKTGDTTTAPGGGYAVPTTLDRMFYDYMEKIGGVRRCGPMVIRSSTGESLDLVTNAEHNTATGSTNEAAAYAATEDTLGKVTVNVRKYTGLAEISQEELTDNVIGLQNRVGGMLARVIGRKTETFFEGKAVPNSTPAGANSQRVTAANAAGNFSPTAQNLIDLLYKLDSAYLTSRLVWMLHPQVYAHILGLTATTGQPLFSAAWTGGASDMILGHRVEYNNMVNNSSKNKPMGVIANWPEYLVIRDVGSVRVEASTEAKFEQDLIVYKASMRCGAEVLHQRAAALLVAANN